MGYLVALSWPRHDPDGIVNSVSAEEAVARGADAMVLQVLGHHFWTRDVGASDAHREFHPANELVSVLAGWALKLGHDVSWLVPLDPEPWRDAEDWEMACRDLIDERLKRHAAWRRSSSAQPES